MTNCWLNRARKPNEEMEGEISPGVKDFTPMCTVFRPPGEVEEKEEKERGREKKKYRRNIKC